MGLNLMENIENKIEQNTDEKGASMVEYVLMAALVAVVSITAITFLGEQTSQAFSSVGSSIEVGNTN